MAQTFPIPIDLLPPLLREFERMVGLHATMALVRRWGVLRVYFPTPERVTKHHPYAAVIGVDALLKLAKEYGGLPHFQLSKAERALQAVRNARIAAEYATNKTAREIAAEYGLTEGQVVRIVASMGVTAPLDRMQRALFQARHTPRLTYARPCLVGRLSFNKAVPVCWPIRSTAYSTK